MTKNKWADTTPSVPFGGLHGSGNDKTQFQRIMELERDLAAAREALSVQRDELDSLQGTHCGGDCLAAPCRNCDGTQHVPGKIDRLKEELEEAQEARQAAEALAESYRKDAERRTVLWTDHGTALAIAQHLKPYTPISAENVAEMLADIRMGLADRAAAIDAAIAGEPL